MFRREIHIGRFDIIIHLKHENDSSDQPCRFFGFPYGAILNTINNKNIADCLETIKGYFLYIGIDENQIIIANDITGGYRLYTVRDANRVFFSDDYTYLLDILSKSGDITLDKNEYHFWERQRYTTGGLYLYPKPR